MQKFLLLIALGNVEIIFNHVAVLHNVFLAFRTNFAFFFCSSNRTEGNENFPINNVCTNKAFFEIGMDFTCGLRGFRTIYNRPSASFLFTCGKIGD